MRDHVLRLTYTAHDMAPFARDLGYEGPPFIWNDEERRHLRARLDALYFHLYGLSKDDAAYILDTFPIVRRHDEAAFGRYRTKEMVLAYYNALDVGGYGCGGGGLRAFRGSASGASALICPQGSALMVLGISGLTRGWEI